MTETPKGEIRQRTITLPATVNDEERQRLKETLRPLAELQAIEIDTRVCRVRYAFPATGFAEIWPRVRTAVGSRLSVLARLRYDLAAVMEDNERDCRLHRGGWHHYVETVHARRFDPLHTGSGNTGKRSRP